MPTISVPHDPPDEEMTPTQAAQLQTLSAEANVTFETGLSKGDAAKRIEALRRRLRGREAPADGATAAHRFAPMKLLRTISHCFADAWEGAPCSLPACESPWQRAARHLLFCSFC